MKASDTDWSSGADNRDRADRAPRGPRRSERVSPVPMGSEECKASGRASRCRDAVLLGIVFAGAVAIVFFVAGSWREEDRASAVRPTERVPPNGTPRGALVQVGPTVDRQPARTVEEVEKGGSEAIEEAVNGSLPEWMQLRVDELEGAWDTLETRQRAAADADVFNEVSTLVQVSLRPLLDELGYGEPIPEGVKVSLASGADQHLMSIGTVVYRFPRGLFPVVDEFMDAWRRWTTLRQAEMKAMGASNAGARPSLTPFTIDERMLQDLRGLKDQARAALLRRTNPY